MSQAGSERPKVIVLDVYETLLDMSDVERRVNHLLDSKRAYIIWFELFMQYCFVDNCTKQFHDFISIGGATLRMAGEVLGRSVDDFEIKGVMEQMKHLPLREGVQKGLSRLHEQQYRIAALTNCPESIVNERMERTGLISYFERVFSAERVRKYKPSVDVYRWAIDTLEVSAHEILLVSAHGWDIAGAENAGMHTAHIKQGKQMLYALGAEPNFTCKNLVDLSDQLSALTADKATYD